MAQAQKTGQDAPSALCGCNAALAWTGFDSTKNAPVCVTASLASRQGREGAELEEVSEGPGSRLGAPVTRLWHSALSVDRNPCTGSTAMPSPAHSALPCPRQPVTRPERNCAVRAEVTGQKARASRDRGLECNSEAKEKLRCINGKAANYLVGHVHPLFRSSLFFFFSQCLLMNWFGLLGACPPFLIVQTCRGRDRDHRWGELSSSPGTQARRGPGTYVYKGRVDVVCVLLAPLHGQNHAVEVICKAVCPLGQKQPHPAWQT